MIHTSTNMAIHATYDQTLVMLSIVVAIGAAYAALELAGRVALTQGRLRLSWLLGGATAMGIGIWSMHFIGMMAFQMPMPMHYDFGTTALSMLIAIIASGVALFISSRHTLGVAPLLAGGLFMGIGIAAMHYVGMAAMRMPAVLHYNPRLFVASILIAIIASIAALWLAFRLKGESLAHWSWKKIGSAVGMGIAIAGMHYIGMQAAIFTPLNAPEEAHATGMSINKLGAAALGFGVLLMLAITIISVYKEYLQRERERHQDRLLQETRELRDKVMQSVSNAIFALDLQGHLTLVNRRAADMTGHPPDALIGQRFSSLFKDASRSQIEANFKQVLSQGEEIRDIETELLGASGEVRTASISMTPLLEGGRVIGVVSTVEDISERKLAQDAIRQLNATLEQRVAERTLELSAINTRLETLNQELEAFSYSVSHDLRAPLRAIHGFSQALLADSQGKLDHESQQHLSRILNASQRMGTLIDDLLDLSQITRSETHRKPLNISAIVHRVVENLQAQQPERRIDFVIQPAVIAYGDARLLEIALENLLGNAWKFTRHQANARIEFGMREGHIYFVHDNGAGFDMNYADKLFTPFQRLHSTKEFEGTGIGLATVGRIITRHDGRIWAEGKPGEGATFYFTLGPIPGNQNR